MEQGRRDHLTVVKERALLVACLLPGAEFDPHDPLDELRSLTDTAGAQVVDEVIQKRHRPDAASFIGSGKVKELGELVTALKVDVVIFDNDLSPAQISNIEEGVHCKVLDRSELILDIFAARARTKEAMLQVELAQMEYTYPRLRAMWSHLERMVGGASMGVGTRGPGEQQLEIDRRIVQKKISDLRREIKEAQGRKEREVQARKKDFFTVGLVGYTNAGKSTLFNTATDGDAYADDKLFATLSTRTRKWNLGEGHSVMLSDTVGFIRDLPHHLVASFKATLEEALHADLLLIIVDVAHTRARQQLQTVNAVLDDIGAGKSNGQERLIVLNKVDLLQHNGDLLTWQQEFPKAIALSARTGRGMDQLVEQVRLALRGGEQEVRMGFDLNDGKAMQFLESRGKVLDRAYEGKKAVYTVVMGSRQLDQLQALGTSCRRLDTPPQHI